MRTLTLVLGLTLVIAACERPMQDGADTAETGAASTAVGADDEWEVLFDGTNLDAWQGYQSDSLPGKWMIEGDALFFNPDSSGPGGDLVTREEFDDFELAFEWRVGDCANSGVIYRADDADEYGAAWETGPEYQILDNTCHPDAENGLHRTAAANYDVHAPVADVTRPAGEWNQARIVVDSARVEHWLNGTMVVEYELWSDEWEDAIAESKWTEYPDYGTARQGYIALQDHGDPVWYRNIRIRRL